nr:basic proline-rich protein-like [Cavia porcellus]
MEGGQTAGEGRCAAPGAITGVEARGGGRSRRDRAGWGRGHEVGEGLCGAWKGAGAGLTWGGWAGRSSEVPDSGRRRRQEAVAQSGGQDPRSTISDAQAEGSPKRERPENARGVGSRQKFQTRLEAPPQPRPRVLRARRPDSSAERSHCASATGSKCGSGFGSSAKPQKSGMGGGVNPQKPEYGTRPGATAFLGVGAQPAPVIQNGYGPGAGEDVNLQRLGFASGNSLAAQPGLGIRNRLDSETFPGGQIQPGGYGGDMKPQQPGYRNGNGLVAQSGGATGNRFGDLGGRKGPPTPGVPSDKGGGWGLKSQLSPPVRNGKIPGFPEASGFRNGYQPPNGYGPGAELGFSGGLMLQKVGFGYRNGALGAGVFPEAEPQPGFPEANGFRNGESDSGDKGPMGSLHWASAPLPATAAPWPQAHRHLIGWRVSSGASDWLARRGAALGPVGRSRGTGDGVGKLAVRLPRSRSHPRLGRARAHPRLSRARASLPASPLPHPPLPGLPPGLSCGPSPPPPSALARAELPPLPALPLRPDRWRLGAPAPIWRCPNCRQRPARPRHPSPRSPCSTCRACPHPLHCPRTHRCPHCLRLPSPPCPGPWARVAARPCGERRPHRRCRRCPLGPRLLACWGPRRPTTPGHCLSSTLRHHRPRCLPSS